MKKNSKNKSVNPAVKSMATLALYLVLLIGMWAIIGYVVFPDKGEADTYAELVAANEPLLTQIAENVIDPAQWEGIQYAQEVQALLEKGNFSETRAENGQAHFIIPTENLSESLTTFVAYCPDGEYHLPEDMVWNVIVSEGKSTRYEDSAGSGSYVTVQKLSEKFYLIESNIAK